MTYREQLVAKMDRMLAEINAMADENEVIIAQTQGVIDMLNDDSEIELSRPEARIFYGEIAGES